MRRIILSLALVSFAGYVFAQDVTTLTLQQSMDYAMQHNYTVKNAQLDVLIQKAQNAQAASNAYPHVNGKVEYTRTIQPQYQFIDASTFPGSTAPPGTIEGLSFTLPYSNNISITASQVIFDGNVFVALKARQTVLNLAMLGGDVTKENVRYNVMKAYNALVVTHKQFEILKASLSYARSLEHDLNVVYKNGLAEKIDVERTAVQVNNLASDSIRISNVLEVSEQVLKYQMGMPLNTPIVLIDTNMEIKNTGALTLLEEREDYNKIPSFNLLQMQLKANELNALRYKLTALPSLSAFVVNGTNYGDIRISGITSAGNYNYPYLMGGITLNMPIFNGLMRTSQLREAKLNVEKSRNNIENMKLGIDFQVEQSRTTLRNAILQSQSERRNLETANDVLDLAQKKYKAGVGSNQEVSQAQTDQLRAQNNYFSSLLDVSNAEADLKKALGLLK